MKKIGVLYNSESPTGCDVYRAILPVKHCQEPLAKLGVELSLIDTVQNSEQFDAIVVHRVVSDSFLRHLLYLQARGKTVVWDHDDLMTDLPPWNPLRPIWRREDRERWEAIKWAACVRTVSTRELAELSGVDGDSVVLPNLVDLTEYPRYDAPKNPDEPLRLVWAGSPTHAEDLKIVVEPIRQLLRKYPGKVRPYFFGYAPNDLIATNFKDVILTKQVEVNHYPRVLASIRPDIGLCPLARHPFNDAKSNCKALEFVAAGGVAVVSDCPAYDFGVKAVKFAKGDSGFFDLVEWMIGHPEDLETTRKQQFELVKNVYSWQSEEAMKKWVDAFISFVR